MRYCGLAAIAAMVLIPSGIRAELIGVAWDANDSKVYRIDERTGAATLLGNSGASRLNSLALGPDGALYSVGGGTGTSGGNVLFRIDPVTGGATRVRSLLLGGREADVRAMAFAPDGSLIAVNGAPSGSSAAPTELFHINLGTGTGTRIGALDEGIVGLDFAPDGTLYGYNNNRIRNLDNTPGLGLVRIDPATGAIADVNPGTVGLNIQSLYFTPGGTLYGVGPESTLFGAGDRLWTIDPVTDAAREMGFLGDLHLRGIEQVPEPGGASVVVFLAATLAVRRPSRFHWQMEPGE